jgi:hypothetical protein
LEPAELAIAFELPEWLSWDPQCQYYLIPLQLLWVVMDQVIEADNPRTETARMVQA